MSKLEILAPAGGEDCLAPAVRLGADAVYLGASQFSARGNASNFDHTALKDAVSYCHIRGVKVYLAMNTLVRDDELPEAMKLVEYACSLPVDALIVQDVGLASLVRSACPGMRLHASTQMSIHTPLGAQMLYDAGFTRVVLARELSLAEIKEIAASSPVELEVFVHGALCMSVSGQCYFSAMLGSRSGNRGLCAQPCRLPFGVPGGTGHDLSLRDCSALSHLQELADIGVTSAKIEGRMKRPEYVAAATAACRLAADGRPVPQDLMDRLGAVFSRTGFTDGYLTGRRGRQMFGVRQKEDVTAATGEVLSQLRAMYKEEPRAIPVDWRLTVKKGEAVCLQVSDGQAHTGTACAPAPQAALHVPLTPEKCREQLEKTGGTPYLSRSFALTVEEGLSVPVSALNRLRRDALEGLSQQRSLRPAAAYALADLPKPGTHRAKAPRLRAHFPDASIPAAFRECEIVYVPLSTKPEELSRLVEQGFSLGVELPRGMFGREETVLRQLEQAKKAGVFHAWAGTLGAVSAAQQAGMATHGGFSLNLFNTASMEWAEDLGLLDAEVSPELTLAQAAALGGALPRGLTVYGRLPLMLTRNCPAANRAGGCAQCHKPPVLTDRKGVSFPLLCEGGCTQIYNAVPTILADRKREIRNIDFLVFRFSVENSVEKEENLSAFHKGIAPKTGFTRGLSYRGVN